MAVIWIMLTLFLSTQSAWADAEVRPASSVPSIPQRDLPGFGSLGNLGLQRVSAATLNYGGWLTPQQDPTDIEQQRLTLQMPVFLHEKDSLSLSAGGTSLHFGQEQFLSSGVAVPVDLWKAEVGGAYSRQLNDQDSFGVRLSVGSASDHPFSDFDVTTISVLGTYTWPSSERSRWTLSLMYSNNNPIANGIPIPGFIYTFQSKTFLGMFGLPFTAMVWMPEKDWMLSFSFFGPTINSEIAYGDPRGVQIFTGWSWAQQSFLRESRPDPKDRMYFVEMHSPIGVRFPVAKNLKSELSVGYSFDRAVYEGTHFTQADDGRVNLGASWYGAWNLRIEM